MTHRVFWFLAFLLLLANLPTADAFMFDAWRSGMNIDKVVATGRDKGIAIEFIGGGFSLFGRNEPDELAVNVEYRGATKLMGYDAKLLFFFAPESRVLHSVSVTLVLPFSSDKADMDVLAEALAKQLDAKYKSYGEPVVESLFDQLSDKVRQVHRRNWKGDGDTVTMETNWKMFGGEVVIIYVDDKLSERAVVEDRRIRQKRLEKSSGDDRRKF